MMKVFNNVKDLLFISVATAPLVSPLEVDSSLYESWRHKMKNEDDNLVPLFEDKASIYPEFGKITAISVGAIREGKVSVQTYVGEDEAALLCDFMDGIDDITKYYPDTTLCGFALKGFDIPFVMKRCVVNAIPFNQIFDIGGVKPWEVRAIDIYEVWNSTGFSKSSLLNICTALKIDYQFVEMDKLERFTEQKVYAMAQVVERCAMRELAKRMPLLQRLFEGEDIEKDDLIRFVGSLKDDEKEEAKNILLAVAGKRDSKIKKKDVQQLF